MNTNAQLNKPLNGLQQLALEDLALRYMGPIQSLNQYTIGGGPALDWAGLCRDVLSEVAQSNAQYTQYNAQVGLSHLLSLYFNISYECIRLNPSDSKMYWVAVFPEDGYVKTPERVTLHASAEEAVCKTAEALNLLAIMAQETGISAQWYQAVHASLQTQLP